MVFLSAYRALARVDEQAGRLFDLVVEHWPTARVFVRV